MNMKQNFLGILSAILFLSNICESQVSFYDSGQNLGNLTSSRVSLGDIDNDGDLDAIVSNWNHRIMQDSKIWLNNGKGIFSENTQTLPSSLYNTSLGDLDTDDDFDIWMNGRVWINDGNGHFSLSSSSYLRGYSALGDLDNDHDLDVFVTSVDDHINRVYFNDSTGNFTDNGQNMQQKCGNAVALGDLDNDGDLDAYVVSGANLENPNGEPDKVWLNDGNGTFYDTGQELGNYQAGNVVLGDVDHDGDLDALVANWHPAPYPINPQPNQLWINDGKGYFTVSDQDFGKSVVSDVALNDLDRDGDLDAFIANGRDTNTGEANQVRINNGYGQFHDPGLRLGNSPSLGVALGDIDGDGYSDAFIANCGIFDGGHPNKVWLNNSEIVALVYNKIFPYRFELKQNYPNPFNPITKIRFYLPKSTFVSIKIYNILGKEITELVNGYRLAGEYEVVWDGKNQPSGIYFCLLKSNEFNRNIKLILQK